jgi:hypothetical protein
LRCRQRRAAEAGKDEGARSGEASSAHDEIRGRVEYDSGWRGEACSAHGNGDFERLRHAAAVVQSRGRCPVIRHPYKALRIKSDAPRICQIGVIHGGHDGGAVGHQVLDDKAGRGDRSHHAVVAAAAAAAGDQPQQRAAANGDGRIRAGDFHRGDLNNAEEDSSEVGPSSASESYRGAAPND